MSLSKHEKICRHCGQPFLPDLRNRARQHYCYKPACRKARKEQSHRIWRAKNPDHFKGEPTSTTCSNGVPSPRVLAPVQSQVQVGAATCRFPSGSGETPPTACQPALQDGVPPLQDSITRNPLILGLITHVFGCTLQDCVEKIIPALIIKGMEIRTMMDGAKTIRRKSAKHDAQKTRTSVSRRRPLALAKWPARLPAPDNPPPTVFDWATPSHR